MKGDQPSDQDHRPRLLFLCQTLPHPPAGGVRIRSYNILRLLAKSFRISALCFYRAANHETPTAVQEAVAALAPLGEVEAFPIPQEVSRARLTWDHLRSVTRRRVYTYFSYESAAFLGRLRELLARTDFDVVHMDSLDLSRYLQDLKLSSVICTHHNVESDLLHRRARAARSWPNRKYLELQAGLMRKEEARWCGSVALNVAVSELDAARFRELSPTAAVTVVPNGVDTMFFTPLACEESGIVFAGAFNWLPNKEAMEFFATEVLPLVRNEVPDVPVTWIGRAPEAVRREYSERFGITMTGYVDDVRPIIQRAACSIAPLRVGGGTRLKILDAWAMGKAVVSTSLGCEGLDARDGQNILVRDAPRAIADAVVRVLQDAQLRHRIGTAARETAESKYDWEKLGRSMTEKYFDLMGNRMNGSGAP